MRADRGVIFVWPVLHIHIGQHLDASGPTVLEGFSLGIGNKVPLELLNAGLFNM